MGPTALSTTSLVASAWKAGIIGVSVGPGLMQLIRMPRAMSSGHHQPTQASMAYLDQTYPLHDQVPSLARSHFRAPSNPSVWSSSLTLSSCCCQPIAADDEMAPMADPSGILGTSCSARCLAPTKLTSIVSSSLKGAPGRPAQLNNPWTGPSICDTACSMDRGSRRSTSKASSTATVVGLMSSAVTCAPRSTRICAVAWPIPDAAPDTITLRPAYPSTSSMPFPLSVADRSALSNLPLPTPVGTPTARTGALVAPPCVAPAEAVTPRLRS